MTGEIMMKAFLGEAFPEVVGIDRDGIPTRVASELVDGGVFPFGGHKGYGLSLAIQALGLLAGARMRNGDVSDFAHLFIAFDPELLMPAEQFTSELEELLTGIKALPKQAGVSEIRIPSERGFRERGIRRKQGDCRKEAGDRALTANGVNLHATAFTMAQCAHDHYVRALGRKDEMPRRRRPGAIRRRTNRTASC